MSDQLWSVVTWMQFVNSPLRPEFTSILLGSQGLSAWVTNKDLAWTRSRILLLRHPCSFLIRIWPTSPQHITNPALSYWVLLQQTVGVQSISDVANLFPVIAHTAPSGKKPLKPFLLTFLTLSIFQCCLSLNYLTQ